jgi:hypothetical protein
MAWTAMYVLVLLASLHAADESARAAGTIRYEPRSFLGYACADDCERHKAGFAWAAQRELTDSTECRALGPVESEGCLAWIEEGIDAEAAGFRWALENEIASPCLCDGAGRAFRTGCLRYLAPPATPNRGRAASKRFRACRPAGKLRR